ncbi:Glycogen phosphorylase [Candidatus Sulfopaludibacter sp. SbA4]|nr:Glycogen phosphorylase [Candidatus Sulfopaludibacter sp. SbA4]
MTKTSRALSLEVSKIATDIQHHLRYTLGRRVEAATPYEMFRALALAIRPRLVDGLISTAERYERHDAKRLYYLSMEFLIGQSLRNNLMNLGVLETCREAVALLGSDLDDLIGAEPDAALGNGGLGRLAACFLESLATLDMPAYGYGINYDYGLFKQEIDNGFQREEPDSWLNEESPWLVHRPDQCCLIPVYGHVDHGFDRHGRFNPMWMDWKVLIGVPHDMPVVGQGGDTINILRLYSARASQNFDIRIFNQGDYLRALEEKIESERVSKILYPSDTIASGRELRLVQEYFLVACAVRDMVRRHLEKHDDITSLGDKVAVQMNDTHPALTVAELMRVLLDEKDLEWEHAWHITCATCAYTNHTLMSEALEKWSVDLIAHVMPRHLEIIYEINHRFLQKVSARFPGDERRLRDMSLILEGPNRQVRMAHLAIVGSHAVNGVAALHSELVKTQLVPDFYELWPEKFQNKTNGVTHRRWLAYANPSLAQLITSRIGDGWIHNFSQIRGVEAYAEDAAFQEEFAASKLANKTQLAVVVRSTTGVTIDPQSIFDVQVKRLHQYKRQLLNVMQIIHHYLRIVEDGESLPVPVTYIFAAKAAPGYYAAKLIIKLINSVGQVINRDPRACDQMRVVFVPDYRVSLAEKIIPAAEVSEQISTAGTEASGTGNMKMAMNGALTVGTLDGANVEILEEVGRENIYIFGLTTEQVLTIRGTHSYDPGRYCREDPSFGRLMEAITGNLFCADEPGLFRSIAEQLYSPDEPYLHFADLPSYIAAKMQIATDYTNRAGWNRKAILNIARMGKFSSDRTVTEYANEIWGIQSIPTA